MRQIQESIRPSEGIPAGLQSNWERRRQAWERRREAWEHLGAPAISLGAPRITVEQSGKTTSTLGTLLVRLEIIATTYRSTILKLMYSVCIPIYVSRYLYSYPSTHGISGLAAGGA